MSVQPGDRPYYNPEFRKFPKIPRLNREMIITEKIDGTNAQLLITEGGSIFPNGRVFRGSVLPGSRKRYLTVEQDNYGFTAWVKEHEDELRQLGPGRHFGEWWGKGINRGYGLDHRRFSLFNVSRWVDSINEVIGAPLPEKDCFRQAVPSCCHVIPILGIFSRFDSFYIAGILEELKQKGSKAAPGFMQPEGIVIYHTAGNNLFKVTLENDEKPKGE